MQRSQVALELFHKMQSCGQDPNPQSLCKNKQIDEAMVAFQKMESKRMDHNIVIYNILINGLFNVGKLKNAREIFYSLPTKALRPNVWTYTIMIKGFFKDGLIDEVVELLEKVDGNGCLPNDRTYNTIIQGLLQHNETSRVMKYLHIMVEKVSVNATTASMFIDLLSTKQVDKNIQELLKKPT